MVDSGTCDRLAIHHCPSLSPFKSLSLSSLQLTAARGKSCSKSTTSMPSCCPVCPVIVYQIKGLEKVTVLLVLIQDSLLRHVTNSYSNLLPSLCFGIIMSS